MTCDLRAPDSYSEKINFGSGVFTHRREWVKDAGSLVMLVMKVYENWSIAFCAHIYRFHASPVYVNAFQSCIHKEKTLN